MQRPTDESPQRHLLDDYSARFARSFVRASGGRLEDDRGDDYIDFFSARGALNYGHGEPQAPAGQTDFVQQFRDIVLAPRALDYRIHHAGASGADAIESAVELARGITGRANVIPFTNAEQDASLGALAGAGNEARDRDSETKLDDGVFIPFNHFYGDDDHSVDQLQTMIASSASAVDQPAAVIVETVQADGGLNTADVEWLRQIEAICRENGVLLILDEVQTGCGRTGPFFSFEPAGIRPDIVCLSRSISAGGPALALTLVRPEHAREAGEADDVLPADTPGLGAASAALAYWESDELQRDTERKAAIVASALTDIAAAYPALAAEARGRGLLQGLAVGPDDLAAEICREALARGLLVEASGPRNEVIKLLPPLTIDEATLRAGLDRLNEAIKAALKDFNPDADAA